MCWPWLRNSILWKPANWGVKRLKSQWTLIGGTSVTPWFSKIECICFCLSAERVHTHSDGNEQAALMLLFPVPHSSQGSCGFQAQDRGDFGINLECGFLFQKVMELLKIKSWEGVVHICTPAVGRQRQESLCVWGQPQLHSPRQAYMAKWNPVSKPPE